MLTLWLAYVPKAAASGRSPLAPSGRYRHRTAVRVVDRIDVIARHDEAKRARLDLHDVAIAGGDFFAVDLRGGQHAALAAHVELEARARDGGLVLDADALEIVETE